ncbi:MAG TPA: ABC transporter ATP-binding protein [Bacilli bacterium]|nr:ABC transporter ATP-binding protein [Bacilli bacterium]
MEYPFVFETKNICIDYQLKKYSLRAVNKVSLAIHKGSITALVGESGSGKTTIATALINCISEPGKIVEGEVLYYHDGTYNHQFGNAERIDEHTFVTHVEKMDNQQLNFFRWLEASMVFQGAQSALNPLMTIFEQFFETMRVHQQTPMPYKKFKEKVERRSREVLDIVNLDSDRVLKMYAHELSGGMKQRVMIAFALLLQPKFIILDEPTTALDVITQDYIFKILQRINREQGITMLLLTHDVGIVAKFADYVGVMYGGQLMEFGTTTDIFKQRLHPYTDGLISSTPSIIADVNKLESIPGNPVDIRNLPPGCVFAPRCHKCFHRCEIERPHRHYFPNGHQVLCHLYSDKTKGDSHE